MSTSSNLDLYMLYHRYWAILYISGIGMMVRVFANGLGDLDSIPAWVIPKIQKLVLDPALLSTQHPGKGVAPSPTPWYSSYWKRNLQVTLSYGRQLYLLYRFKKNNPNRVLKANWYIEIYMKNICRAKYIINNKKINRYIPL